MGAEVTFKEVKTVREHSFRLGKADEPPRQRDTCTGSGPPCFGDAQDTRSLPARQWGKGPGALPTPGCGEFAPGLLVFPTCKAHDFIFPLKVSLLISLPHLVERVHLGRLRAFLSQEPLRETARAPRWREEKKRGSRGQVPSCALSLLLLPESQKPGLLPQLQTLKAENSAHRSLGRRESSVPLAKQEGK